MLSTALVTLSPFAVAARSLTATLDKPDPANDTQVSCFLPPPLSKIAASGSDILVLDTLTGSPTQRPISTLLLIEFNQTYLIQSIKQRILASTPSSQLSDTLEHQLNALSGHLDPCCMSIQNDL